MSKTILYLIVMHKSALKDHLTSFSILLTQQSWQAGNTTLHFAQCYVVLNTFYFIIYRHF